MGFGGGDGSPATGRIREVSHEWYWEGVFTGVAVTLIVVTLLAVNILRPT